MEILIYILAFIGAFTVLKRIYDFIKFISQGRYM